MNSTDLTGPEHIRALALQAACTLAANSWTDEYVIRLADIFVDYIREAEPEIPTIKGEYNEMDNYRRNSRSGGSGHLLPTEE